MTVRAVEIIEDCQKCFSELIKQLCSATAPWTSWIAVLGYPETRIWETTKAVIYIEPPMQINTRWQQGGLGGGEFEMIIGAWDNRKEGGTEEINIINSRILALMMNPSTLNTSFDVTLGSAFTSTTLVAQGIIVTGVIGPREIETEDRKEFRSEFVVNFIA